MKVKIRNIVILAIIFFGLSLSQVFAGSNNSIPETKHQDFESRTYIIGNYEFTPGTAMTTQRIMLAAKSIDGDRLEDMKVYYKNAEGKWLNGITKEEIPANELPKGFVIEHIINEENAQQILGFRLEATGRVGIVPQGKGDASGSLRIEYKAMSVDVLDEKIDLSNGTNGINKMTEKFNGVEKELTVNSDDTLWFDVTSANGTREYTIEAKDGKTYKTTFTWEDAPFVIAGEGDNRSLVILKAGSYSSTEGVKDNSFANLYIASSVGNGTVTLSNVRVTGQTYVLGGGSNSVIFKDCKLNGLEIAKEVKPGQEIVRVEFTDGTVVDFVKISTEATITLGNNSDVKKITIEADDVKIVAAAGVTNYEKPAVEVKGNNADIDIETSEITHDSDVEGIVVDAKIAKSTSTEGYEWANTADKTTWNGLKVTGPLYYVENPKGFGEEPTEHYFSTFEIAKPALDYKDATILLEGLSGGLKSSNMYNSDLVKSEFDIYGKFQVVFGVEENEKEIKVTVDWDGLGTVYKPTTYTIDLTEVTLKSKVDSSPEFVSATTEGEIVLNNTNPTFVFKIKSNDDMELKSLEIDHSYGGVLPEFKVYANKENPYGTDSDKTAFETQGVNVTYSETDKEWTINFGNTVTNLIKEKGITLYTVIENVIGNKWGTMYGTTDENTFVYTFKEYVKKDLASTIVTQTTEFGNKYYNKFTNSTEITPADTANFDSSVYYVEIGGVTGTEFTELKIGENIYDNSVKKISIGNNAFIEAPLWKVENEKLYISLLLISMDAADSEYTQVELSNNFFEVKVFGGNEEQNKLSLTGVGSICGVSDYTHSATITNAQNNKVTATYTHGTTIVGVKLKAGADEILAETQYIFRKNLTVGENNIMGITIPEKGYTYMVYPKYENAPVTTASNVDKQYMIVVPGKGQIVINFKFNAEILSNVAVVKNETELRQAITDDEKNYIKLMDDIELSANSNLKISKSITLDGNGKTLNIAPDLSGEKPKINEKDGILILSDDVTIKNLIVSINGTTENKWQGVYGIQAYNNKNVVLKDVSVTGADAAILVNGAKVTLEGIITVTGNEFGGIEVSQGTAIADPKLIVNGTVTGPLTDLPYIWIDKKTTNDEWVEGTTLQTEIQIEKNQLWFIPAN